MSLIIQPFFFVGSREDIAPPLITFKGISDNPHVTHCYIPSLIIKTCIRSFPILKTFFVINFKKKKRQQKNISSKNLEKFIMKTNDILNALNDP